ncbi:MAG: cysteine desulfurase family protein [Alphaproteobacteria bacterium]
MTAYCDYNAGAPVRPEAIDAVARGLTWAGNPSSVHQAGRRARGIVENAREIIGAAVNARPADIVFTSGATEALRLAIEGARAVDPGISFIRSAIEHDALAEMKCDAEFGVDRRGVADLNHLEEVLRAARGRPLVALMLVNNETGAIQPVAAAIELVRKYNGLVLCDAAQAFGRLNLHAAELGADYLVISSHKIGGPHGAGALILSCDAPFAPPNRGGRQERGRRPGTENVPGIAGFGAAAECVVKTWAGESARLKALRDRLERRLREEVRGVEIVGADAPRVSNTSVFALPGLKAETAVIAFDLNGVCVSAGAACSSGKVRRSRVLEAMGLPVEVMDGAVRASFGWGSNDDDVDALIAAAGKIAVSARVKEFS